MNNSNLIPVNIIVGRFQPLTDGHIKCAEEIYRKTGIKSVLLLVSNPDNRRNALKPFSSDKLSYMYANLLATGAFPYIEGFITVKNADIVKNHSQLMSAGYVAVSWSCGSDRFADYTNMCDRYHKEAGLPDNFHVYEIKRTKHDISATKVRFSIASGDFDAFIKQTPFKAMNRNQARKAFDRLMLYYAEALNDFSF